MKELNTKFPIISHSRFWPSIRKRVIWIDKQKIFKVKGRDCKVQPSRFIQSFLSYVIIRYSSSNSEFWTETHTHTKNVWCHQRSWHLSTKKWATCVMMIHDWIELDLFQHSSYRNLACHKREIDIKTTVYSCFQSFPFYLSLYTFYNNKYL